MNTVLDRSKIISKMSVIDSRAQFVLPNDQPVLRLEVETAFHALNDTEKLYSHYLSQASWYGGLIVLYQTSPESPDIFRLIHPINTAEDSGSLTDRCL